jgi:hypothetical protein
MNTHRKRPRDPNQLGKLIIDIATGQVSDHDPKEREKDQAAVTLGRRGGLKGGKARAEALSGRQRKQIAKKAAEARWRKPEPN